MWGRLGPRFAVEAAFLILLAVGLGLADQDWVVIVAVMAAGWALVSLIELVASRRAAAQWRVGSEGPAVDSSVGAAPPPIEAPAPPVPPAPEPLPVEPAPEPEALPPPAPEYQAPEETMEVVPAEGEAQPPKRRRWFRRRKSADAEQASEERIPEPPKHVRKLEPEDAEEHARAESAEGH